MAKINESEAIKGKIINDDTAIKGKIGQGETPIKAELINDYTESSTTKKGVIRIATADEVIEGVSNKLAITPYTLKLATNYVHEQGIASREWIINHNLNKRPSITVVDSAENVIEGKEIYINENTIKINFNNAFKGKAYLN